MAKRVKIINIIPHFPAYKYCSNEPRPRINFDTPSGQWVGIWGLDCPHILGNEILKLTDKFEYEVWQPDSRADKIYSHTFENGLTHKSFPAVNRKEIFGVKFVDRVDFATIVRELERRVKKEKIILHLHGNPILYKHFTLSFEHFSVIFSFHGETHLPYSELFLFTKNIPSKLNNIIDHFWTKEKINKIDCITYQSNKNIEYLRKIYKGALVKITNGCDFSFYKHRNQEDAREEIALPKEKKIFFLASNFTKLKQIDKIIRVFTDFSDHYDFLLLIAGHGTEKFENYLEGLSRNLMEKNKIRFVGYIRGKKLVSYYNACDFFLSVSTEEGIPVSVVKAFACEIPVISTKTGNTAELMKRYDCGRLLDIYDYRMWRNELAEILEGEKVVRSMSREIAKRYYDWPNIASKQISIYNELAKKYYQ